MEYLSAFMAICLSNTVNMQQCAKVWEYMPGYVVDYYQFKTEGIYCQERSLKNDINFWSLISIGEDAAPPLAPLQNCTLDMQSRRGFRGLCVILNKNCYWECIFLVWSVAPPIHKFTIGGVHWEFHAVSIEFVCTISSADGQHKHS